jgi:uncharacterized protein YggE
MFRIFLISMLSLAVISISLAQTKNFIDQPYIEVVGYADTLVTPNLIYIKIIIDEKDSRDKISLEEQEYKMITSFKNLGLNTEVDLTTSDMLSNYKFYFLKKKDIIKTKEYILTVTSAETASRVFMQLEDLGISNTSIHKVDHADLENIKNLCRTKAIQNSFKKAVAMTKPLAQTVGNAIYIAESDNHFENQLNSQLTGVQVVGYSSREKAKYEPPKIEFEKIKVSSTLNVKYVLK